MRLEGSTHARMIRREDFVYASQRWQAWGILMVDPAFNPDLSVMNTTPLVWGTSIDNPQRLHTDLMRRLPRKTDFALPADLKSILPYRLRALAEAIEF
jgi:hypothetical protein